MNDIDSNQRRSDRLATEARLTDAALHLLHRDGVLAGLNLRLVADNASVNRGLVYQYFGSRRALLRAALRRNSRRRLSDLSAAAHLSATERYQALLRMLLSNPDVMWLNALLVLDGADDLELMPLRNEAIARLADEMGKGNLVVEDLEVLHVLTVCTIFGYSLFRRNLAAELKRPVEDLDERFTKVLEAVRIGFVQ